MCFWVTLYILFLFELGALIRVTSPEVVYEVVVLTVQELNCY